MFQKNLTDIIRGIRSNKANESKYINQCIAEIKEELKQTDVSKKAVAIQKLCYLQMLGYDMQWAAFNVIEVMTSNKPTHKRIGYMAASLSFTPETEVIMLCTQLLKKDLASSDQYESGLAINCLSNICTTDLARDLVTDIVAMLNSSKPYIRKKAVLVLYKIFLQFPGALRPSFPRLREKLEDPNTSVVTAAVNVICELARMNPEKYLTLAPIFFKLLTTMHNNWMLIKIVKLFGALTPYEPRLAKKLAEPLTNLINSTPAMSLLYECINTCTIGLANHAPTMRLCISKLRIFIEDDDQNLKYLGLLALANIMKKHPKAIGEHKLVIMECLNDADVTIRSRALDLLAGMVTKKNLQDIVRHLLDQVNIWEGPYRESLIKKIIEICSGNSYGNIRNFEWYVSVLVELTRVRGTIHGKLIAAQLLDVAIRVKVVRVFIVGNMINLLLDPRFLADTPGTASICEVLYAAAWIVGEFSDELHPSQFPRVVEAMMQPRVTTLPAHIQAVYVQNAFKLYSRVFAEAHAGGAGSGGSTTNLLGGDDITVDDSGSNAPDPELLEAATRLRDILNTRLPQFATSFHLEVQERAVTVQEVLRLADAVGPAAGADLANLFAESLPPVHPEAQRKVPLPDGLDLDAWINEPPAEDEWNDNASDFDFLFTGGEGSDDTSSFMGGSNNGDDSRRGSVSNSARYQSIYHLGSAPTHGDEIDVDSIPIEEIQIDAGELHTRRMLAGRGGGGGGRGSGGGGGGRRRKKRRGGGGGGGGGGDDEVEYQIDMTVAMPEGFTTEDTSKNSAKNKRSALADALNIDISAPLADDETLPAAPTHRVATTTAAPAADEPAVGKSGRRRRRRGGAAAAAAAAAPAASTGGGGGGAKGKSTSSGGGAKGKSTSSGGGGGGGLLIDFDAPPTTSTTTTAAAPAATNTSSNNGSVDILSGFMSPSEPAAASGGSGGSAPAAPAEGGKRRRRRRGEGGGAGGAGGSSAPASGRLLCSNGTMAFHYEVRPNSGGDSSRVDVSVSCTNTSGAAVSGIEFNIVDSVNAKVIYASPLDSTIKTGISLAGGSANTINIPFSFTDVGTAQTLRGNVSYFVQGRDGSSTSQQQNFALRFPVSAFIIATAISESEFGAVCTNPNVRFMAQAKVRSNSAFADAVSAIATHLSLHIVLQTSNSVSLYGKSVRGDHVACLLKDGGDSVVAVAIKTNNENLPNALTREVAELFGA